MEDDESVYFVYRARDASAIDGDTVDATLDLGFGMYHRCRVRLVGVDTHEIYGVEHGSEEFDQGRIEAQWVKDWLDDAADQYDGGWPLAVSTLRDRTGKYGRYLAEIYRRDTGEGLTMALLNQFDDIAD